MHFNTPQNTILSSESPPACPGSATRLVSSGLPAQGDFLFSDDPIVNWFDSQDEVTARFWIDCAADLFGLPDSDSATPRQCWHAFLLFANTGVLAPPPLPVLVTHSAVVRKYGPPSFVAYLPSGMLHRRDGDGLMPFWSLKAFQGYLAVLRAHGYRVAFDSPSVAFVFRPGRGGALHHG